jgi:hypothetical protein
MPGGRASRARRETVGSDRSGSRRSTTVRQAAPTRGGPEVAPDPEARDDAGAPGRGRPAPGDGDRRGPADDRSTAVPRRSTDGPIPSAVPARARGRLRRGPSEHRPPQWTGAGPWNARQLASSSRRSWQTRDCAIPTGPPTGPHARTGPARVGAMRRHRRSDAARPSFRDIREGPSLAGPATLTAGLSPDSL